jgi:tRNA(Ile)-lysidine synthase
MNGDRFTPLGMKNMTKLKDFFISLKIPKEERKTIPLLLSDGNIVWIVGHRIDERFKITEKTKKILKATTTPFRSIRR